MTATTSDTAASLTSVTGSGAADDELAKVGGRRHHVATVLIVQPILLDLITARQVARATTAA
jgi:hypothetical protein